MTNKFRDALELWPRTGSSVETLGRFQFDFTSTIKQALTIAAELQDEAETIKALDDAGDVATQRRWYLDIYEGAPARVSNIRTEDGRPILKNNGLAVRSGNEQMNNGYFITVAANARPIIKKLANLVKEGE